MSGDGFKFHFEAKGRSIGWDGAAEDERFLLIDRSGSAETRRAEGGGGQVNGRSGFRECDGKIGGGISRLERGAGRVAKHSVVTGAICIVQGEQRGTD